MLVIDIAQLNFTYLSNLAYMFIINIELNYQWSQYIPAKNMCQSI